MNVSEHNADLFQTREDPSSESPALEMRISAREVMPESRPAADAASDIGPRLKAAREARGLDLQACGQALRLPARVLAKLEAGDFGNADDHVFTRGALQSYARLLQVPSFAVDAAMRVSAPPQQPVLIPTGNALRGNWLQRYGAAATYIVLTATVAVPLAWLGLRGGLDTQLTRIAPLDSAPAAVSAQHVAQAVVNRQPSKPAQEQPLMASMTPFQAMRLESGSDASAQSAQQSTPAAPGATRSGHVLSLTAHGDSWIEVTDASGKTLASGMLHAGDTRSYQSSSALDVTLGNVDAVDVQSDGKPLSLDAYRHANVARFKVFAAGPGNG